MHIILDARTATPHFPGIGRYVTSLTRALLPELSPDDRLTVLYDAEYPQLWPNSPQFQAIPLNLSPFGLAQQWVIPQLLKRLDGDLYHSAYYLMPYRPGIPSILTVYDVIPLLFPDQSSFRARCLFRWAMLLALRAVQRVIAISQSTQGDFIAHFRSSAGKLTAIPLAVDPAFCPQPPEGVAAVRARYGLPEQFVLYLGSNKPHKNLVRLIDAWSHITEYGIRSTLVLAGAWDARYPESRQRVAALGLEDTVRFLGPLPEADLPAFYSAATAFVFPSLYEGFGFPILEAMACGAPVVCSDTSSLPEVAGDAVLYVNPLSIDSIAEGIARVWQGSDLRAAMREKGYAQAAKWSWKRTALQTLQVYRELVNDR